MHTVSAHDVANYFLYLDSQNSESDGISNLKMQKLIYYAYGFHQAIFQDKLFDDAITAWKHGPVCESLYHTYNGYGKCFIPFNAAIFDASSIPVEKQALLSSIYNEYSQYSAWKLSALTHEEMPWLNGRERLEANGDKGCMLDEDFVEHFTAIVSSNEIEALLEERPEIVEDVEAIKNGTFVGVSHEEAMEALFVS